MGILKKLKGRSSVPSQVYEFIIHSNLSVLLHRTEKFRAAETFSLLILGLAWGLGARAVEGRREGVPEFKRQPIYTC